MAIVSDANGRREPLDPARAQIAYHQPDTNTAGHWPQNDPLADRSTQPYRDDDTITLVDDLIDSLIIVRSGATADSGAQLSVIASLQAELDSRLPETIFAARDQGYTWAHIAGRLAMAETTVRRHYSDYVTCRKEIPFDNLD